MSDVKWSWVTGWDYRQNEAIEDLQAEAARATDRMRHAQRQTRDLVKSQISTVNNRLDTVMDWLDLRFAQLDFDEYTVRREARNHFRALAAHDLVAIRELDDVPGYWLPPLAGPLAKLVLRRQNRDAGPFDTASLPAEIRSSLQTGRERDPVRGDLFTVATAICFDLPALSEEPVLRLLAGPMDLEFGEDPAIVANGWRTLWEQAVQSEFGPAAAEQLTQRLAAGFDPQALDAKAEHEWDTAILRHSGDFDTTVDADRALPALAATLSRLSEAVSAEPDRSRHRETWQTCLQDLVSEPSEPERPLVEAMRRLRPASETDVDEPDWRRREGSVATLLRDDLVGNDVPAARRAVALRIAGPYLRQRVEAVAESEAAKPDPTVTVKDSGLTITVGPDGPDPAAYDKAVERRRVEPAWVVPLPLILGITAALLAVAILAAINQAWVMAVIVVCLIAIPVWWRLGTRSAARRVAADAQERVADLATRVDRAVEQARMKQSEHWARQDRIRTAVERLLEVLPKT